MCAPSGAHRHKSGRCSESRPLSAHSKFSHTGWPSDSTLCMLFYTCLNGATHSAANALPTDALPTSSSGAHHRAHPSPSPPSSSPPHPLVWLGLGHKVLRPRHVQQCLDVITGGLGVHALQQALEGDGAIALLQSGREGRRGSSYMWVRAAGDRLKNGYRKPLTLSRE